jgi:hypothetical protein
MIHRQRLNVLPSAARTATITSAKFNGRDICGLIIYVNVTVAGAGGGLTAEILGYDAAGNARRFFAATAPLTATGTAVYVLSPDDMVAAADVTQVAKLPVPFEWAYRTTVGNTDAFTYSVVVETF